MGITNTPVYDTVCEQVAAMTNAMLNSITPGAYSVFHAVDTAPTISAAELVAGVVDGVPTVSRAYTLPVASDVLAASPQVAVNGAVLLAIKNKSISNATIVVTASASMTNGGIAADFVVQPGKNALYLVVFTDITTGQVACVLYRIDTASAPAFKSVTTTNANAVISATQIIGGIVTSTTAAAVTATMPAAAALLALVPGAVVGSAVKVTVKNIGATNAITVANSATITNQGSVADLTIAPNTNATYDVVFTDVTPAAEAAVYYRN